MIAKQAIAVILSIYTLIFGVEVVAEAPHDKQPPSAVAFMGQVAQERSLDRFQERKPSSPYEGIQFKHGDISWLPRLALQAGWEEHQLKRLGHIILRESGGCPYRAGGDVVDKECNVVKVSEWNHRSDTGLLQINGVHWKRDHAQYHGLVCKQMKVCTQEELMDPLTNLRAGRLLFEVAGWSPWDVCQWNPKACGKGKKG